MGFLFIDNYKSYIREFLKKGLTGGLLAGTVVGLSLATVTKVKNLMLLNEVLTGGIQIAEIGRSLSGVSNFSQFIKDSSVQVLFVSEIIIALATATKIGMMQGSIVGSTAGLCAALKVNSSLSSAVCFGASLSAIMGIVQGILLKKNQACPVTGAVVCAATSLTVGFSSSSLVGLTTILLRKLSKRNKTSYGELCIGLICAAGSAVICCKKTDDSIFYPLRVSMLVGAGVSGISACIFKSRSIQRQSRRKTERLVRSASSLSLLVPKSQVLENGSKL